MIYMGFVPHLQMRKQLAGTLAKTGVADSLPWTGQCAFMLSHWLGLEEGEGPGCSRPRGEEIPPCGGCTLKLGSGLNLWFQMGLFPHGGRPHGQATWPFSPFRGPGHTLCLLGAMAALPGSARHTASSAVDLLEKQQPRNCPHPTGRPFPLMPLPLHSERGQWVPPVAALVDSLLSTQIQKLPSNGRQAKGRARSMCFPVAMGECVCSSPNCSRKSWQFQPDLHNSSIPEPITTREEGGTAGSPPCHPCHTSLLHAVHRVSSTSPQNSALSQDRQVAEPGDTRKRCSPARQNRSHSLALHWVRGRYMLPQNLDAVWVLLPPKWGRGGVRIAHPLSVPHFL